VYRFALRPWWIVSHVIVLALVVVMVNLGLWQLRRLDEVRERNDHLAERIAAPPEPIEELVPVGAGTDADVDAVVDRQATARGTYRPDEQVLIRGRSLDDRPGSWVVVPLELADGRVVAVNRGWISNDGRHTAVPEEYVVPDGEVDLTGLLHPTQTRGTLGATDPDDGVVASLARIDLARLDEQVEGDLLPVWLQLTEPEPSAPDPSPTVLGLPDVDDEGSHMSYAVQWFIFATIAACGYPLILRRRAREHDRGVVDLRDADGPPDPDAPDPDDEPGPGDPRLDAPVGP
jgi:surfeit locus 1 family protein